MGLLDDAIREHLDLKRRRGADPAEVERAEREALGPVRRNPGPGEVPAVDDLTSLEEEPSAPVPAMETEVYDVPGEYDWAEEPAASASAPADTDLGPGDESLGGGGVPSHEDRPPLPSAPDEPRFEAADPMRAGGPHAGEEGEDLDAATAEYHLEERPEPAPGEADGEDVLEETPDFLQDTPEHDRLWFEQRPPRDFDFDG